MKPREISHHVESSLEIAQGIIDLHTHVKDFHETWASYLEQLRDRADEELTKTNILLEQARQQEARHEPEHTY